MEATPSAAHRKRAIECWRERACVCRGSEGDSWGKTGSSSFLWGRSWITPNGRTGFNIRDQSRLQRLAIYLFFIFYFS